MDFDRTQSLKAMKRDYPDMPMFWLETVFDFIQKHPEKAQGILDGSIEVPPPKPRDTDPGRCVEYESEEHMKRLESIGKIECVVQGTGN